MRCAVIGTDDELPKKFTWSPLKNFSQNLIAMRTGEVVILPRYVQQFMIIRL